MNRGYLQEFVDYIANTGGGPTLEQFDEDWEPIGPKVRADLKAARMTVELDGRIYDAAKDAVSLIRTKKITGGDPRCNHEFEKDDTVRVCLGCGAVEEQSG